MASYSTATNRCRCKTRRGAVGLYYTAKDKFGDVVWVCSDCRLPLQPGFEKYLARCENCLDEFSSPWEEICIKCHKLEHSEMEIVDGKVVTRPHTDTPKYKGWLWGAAQGARERTRARQAGFLSTLKPEDLAL